MYGSLTAHINQLATLSQLTIAPLALLACSESANNTNSNNNPYAHAMMGLRQTNLQPLRFVHAYNTHVVRKPQQE
jgi:hypothetical protein